MFLDKACLTIDGKITRATLLLVGKETSAHKLNHIAQIVWKCFQDGQVFGDIYTIPFIRTTSELLGRIRNYRFKIYPKNSLIPAEVWKYDTESILEGMHNSIAHQKYEVGARIIVTEKQDSLKFQNDGNFYEGDYKQYITGEKTPKSYRGPQALDVLQYYQGFSPYADPTTGFEKSYEVKFGNKPTFAECKFYDALMLVAFAASYAEHHADVTDINQAIIAITTPHAQQLWSAAWSQTSMELYLSALEQGQLMDFKGASGEIRFDNETYTSAIHTTYVHWQIQDGKIEHRNYLSSDGSHHTSSTMAAWSWLVKNAEEEFAQSAENKDAGIHYPALTAQYAVLVQGSNGWNNYRHQTDVLSIYQMLKKNGFDDDHIILVIDKALASDSKNPEPGVIRAEDGGQDLMAGSSMDYDNAALSPTDISNILLGVKTDKTPVVLPKDAGQNVLLFWSGHGHNRAANGADELAWRNADAGRGMTADLLRQTISQMQQQGLYRKMLVLTEPCFSEAVITPLVGIPGVLAMSSAGAYEQSFADNWSSELGVWRCDRFSRNLVTHLTASPTTTYRDLFLYCAQRTLGSHVHIVNSAHFGNLYTTGPQEFFEK